METRESEVDFFRLTSSRPRRVEESAADSRVGPGTWLLLLLGVVGLCSAMIGWAHEHGYDGTVKQIANTVQTSLHNIQGINEVQNRIEPSRNRPFIYNYEFYSTGYAVEASEDEP